jgi:hypothetical protein
VALQDSNKKITKTLEVSSEVLDNIHEEFKTIVSECGIRIHSFQEAQEISGMKGLDKKVDCSILPFDVVFKLIGRSWTMSLQSSIYHDTLR